MEELGYEPPVVFRGLVRQHFSRWYEGILGGSSLTRVDGCLRGIEAEKQDGAEAKECGFEFGQEFKISETDDA